MKQIVHVHVPKTGGTWLNNVLNQNLDTGIFLGGEHLAIAGGIEVVAEWRPDAKDCVDCADVSIALLHTEKMPEFPGRWNNSLKLSICRNPFDMLVSYYCHEEPHPAKHPGWGWAWASSLRRSGVPAGWDCINLTHGIRSFDEFIKKFCEPNFKWHHGLRRRNLFYQMFHRDGACGVDVIMRNEKLTGATQALLIELGYIDRSHLFKGGAERSNKTSGKKDYRSFYTDELREMIEKKCAAELALFEYNFDGPVNDDSFIDPIGLWYRSSAQKAMKNGHDIL